MSRSPGLDVIPTKVGIRASVHDRYASRILVQQRNTNGPKGRDWRARRC